MRIQHGATSIQVKYIGVQPRGGWHPMHLTRRRNPMNNKIQITWHIEDVIYRGKERGINLTEEEAIDILDTLKDNHDSTIGINWDVIDDVTDFRLDAP